jgi:outer membrane protein OmpA-like peptidoglycan-associated protein
MKNQCILPVSLIAAAVLSACSSLPAGDSPLTLAHNDYRAAQANPQVTTFASGELRQAGDSLEKADRAADKHKDRDVIDHLAYVARQQVAIAQETASQKSAEAAVANAGAERDRIRLAARTREADSAQRNAEISQRSAEDSQRRSEASLRESQASQRQSEASQLESQAAQRQSEASQRESEASQRSAEAAQRDAASQRQAANDAQTSAQAARVQTQDAQDRSRRLEEELATMQAKKTERGMVITLGDVLFDTDRAQLRSGGMHNVQKLADFFKQYPERNVLIEGFTDSTGGTAHNQSLSDDRANSVRTALLGMGMNADRITSRGYGESYPVASNDTAANRQLNRRVEITVSNDSKAIAPR